MMRLIALTGYKGSGKTHLASALFERLSQRARRPYVVSFAQPLRSAVARMLQISESEVLKYKDVEHPVFKIKTRPLLISLGRAAILQNKNIFVDLLIRKIVENSNRYNVFIIDDMRFLHEYYEMLTFANTVNADFLVVRVKNENVTLDKNDEVEKEIDQIPYDVEYYAFYDVPEKILEFVC